MSVKEVVITFKPYQLVTVSGPEKLAENGISMYPPALAKYWGPDAPDRYQKARGLAPYPTESETPQQAPETTG